MTVQRMERDIQGRRVSLLHTVRGADPSLVLLHGIPTSSELWRPVMERLKRVRAIAPDLPGYGESAPPANPSIGAYHRFIAGLAEAEGLNGYVLAGHDLGGLYALTYAVAHPERLRGLVLLNTTTYPDAGVALGLLPLLAPGFGEAYAWLASHPRYRQPVARDLRSMYPAEADEQMLRRLVAPYARTESWYGIVRSLRGLNPVRVLAWKHRMGELRLPILLLWGEGDPYFPASVPQRLHRNLPGSRLEYVADGGHFVMLKQPDAVATALTEFVARLQDAAGDRT